MHTESNNLKETLQPILRVLNDLGGKFSFTDDEDNQFVLASKEVFENEQARTSEQQLALPQAETVSRAIRKHIGSSLQDDVLDRINRDIALTYALKQELEEEEMDDLATTSVSADTARIRFEPLRGDLSPELQG